MCFRNSIFIYRLILHTFHFLFYFFSTFIFFLECFQCILVVSSGGHCSLVIIRGCGISSSQVSVSSSGGISVFLRIIYGSLFVRFDSLIGGLAVLEDKISLFGFAFYFNRYLSCFPSMWWSSLSVMARKATKSLFEDCLCLRCGLAGGKVSLSLGM